MTIAALKRNTRNVTAVAYHAPSLLMPVSIQPSRPPWWRSGRSSSAASAGESVSALKAEIAIANAMVSENCLYRMPVVPGKKLTGTKTEMSTSEVAMTALVTSRMPTLVASMVSAIPSEIWR